MPITQPSSLLPRWLIEPCLHIVLPMLAEVPAGDDIVMLNHGLPYI